MMISNQDRTDCLVVGAGALGLLLAASIRKSLQIQRSSGHVAVFNRRPFPGRITVELPGDETVDFTRYVTSELPAWFGNNSSQQVVFFCLPPESTEAFSLSLLEKIKDRHAFGTKTWFVFCNNGCLSEPVINEFSELTGPGALVRALFFVGAVRVVEQNNCSVRWTGGNRVAWNILASSEDPVARRFADILEMFSYQMSSGETFIDWSQVSPINAMERNKFFTNFMIAAGVGRQRERNKNLYNRLNSGTLDVMASQCAKLWQLHGVNENELKSVLGSTVAATGENINSLSLAAVNGNTSTMKWFLDFLTMEVAKSECFNELEPLRKFIEAIRAEWGIVNE